MPEDPVLGGLSEDLAKIIEDPASFTAALPAAPSAATIMKGLKIKGLSLEEKKPASDAPPATPPEPPPPPPEESGAAPSAEALEALRADLPELGLFGLLVALSDAPAPVEDVYTELPAKIAERIRTQLAEERAKAPADAGGEAGVSPAAIGAKSTDGLGFRDLVTLYRDEKGPKVVRKLVENTMYDFYDLKDHGLFIDDIARVVDLFGASAGEHDDIKAFVKRLAALSSDTSKFMLGLFPEQIALIHKVMSRQAERKEIDDAFENFGPRAIWKRLLAIVKTLIQKEKRLRLAITLWARMSGVAITREQVLEVEKHLAIKDVRALVRRALARPEARKALIEFRKAHAGDISALEATF